MKIKRILISQPAPAELDKSPYKNLVGKHNLDLTFYKFFDVVGISASDFRKTRIHLVEHSAIVFNSKMSVDHFFRMAKELREVIPETMKYFCSTELVANYLQKHIVFRKRKIFFAQNGMFSELVEIMTKHREEKFLFPCSDEKQTEYTKALDKAKLKYTKAPMYTSKPKDLSQFKLEDYDMIALFSPYGVRSLTANFPNAAESNIIVAAFGNSTQTALKEAGIKLTVSAPNKAAPSMAMAIENYITGKDVEVATPKVTTTRRTEKASKTTVSIGTGATKKVKPVIANKAVYKQRMEEKKAEAAARRAARAAERKAKEEAEKGNE